MIHRSLRTLAAAALVIGVALVAVPIASAGTPVSTTTTFTVTPDPGLAHQGSTLHVTVTPSGGGTFNCGFIRVYDAGVQITGPFLDHGYVDAGPIGNFDAGVHELSVHFEGCSQDGFDYQPSDSATYGYTVNPVPSSTTLTASANPVASDQSVTLTSTTNLKSGYTSPGSPGGGTVRFYDGSRLIGTSTIDANVPQGYQAHITPTLSHGTRNLKAVFAGYGNWATSTSPIYKETVQGIDTTIALSSSADPSVFGQKAVYATITPSRATTATLSGYVTFYDAGVKIASTALPSTGIAYLVPAHLPVGTHTLTATYGGNAAFNPSPTSAPLSQQVNQASSTTKVTSSLNPSHAGDSVMFTATVRAVAPATGYPPGTVTFRDGSTVLGSVPLSSTGKATLSTAALTVGSHPITATYGGSTGYAGSTSATLTQTVQP